MLKTITFILIGLFIFQAQAVSLLEENKEIECKNQTLNVLIERKDRYFEVNGEKFTRVEFLDRAILGKNDSGEKALIQIIRPDRALLVKGPLVDFVEGDCVQVSDHKVCKKDGHELFWAPTWLKLAGTQYSLHHYGVYPNDGTYFIGFSQTGETLALMDFGSRFMVITGETQWLTCGYL